MKNRVENDLIFEDCIFIYIYMYVILYLISKLGIV